MYHEGTWSSKAYYDTMEEMPTTIKVTFPQDGDKPKKVIEMTREEVLDLDSKGWYTIINSSNYGVCDHWTSEKPSTWVRKRFDRIIRYVNDKKETVGYNREGWSLLLTREANYWKSEVWNS